MKGSWPNQFWRRLFNVPRSSLPRSELFYYLARECSHKPEVQYPPKPTTAREPPNPLLFNQCMSFVPPPQKAPAPGTANQNNGVATNAAADAVAEVTAGVEDAFITSRTFDLYWVDKSALMYKDGIVKVCICVAHLWYFLLCEDAGPVRLAHVSADSNGAASSNAALVFEK